MSIMRMFFRLGSRRGPGMAWTAGILLALAWIPLTAVGMPPVHDSGMPEAVAGSVRPGAMATFDRHGRLWVVRVHDGHVWVSHSDDPEHGFSQSVAVNPKPQAISASQENHPDIVVTDDGTVHVTWVRRLGKKWASEILHARSTDGGRHFSVPRPLHHDREALTHAFDVMRVDAAGRLVVAWIDGREMVHAMADGGHHRGLSVYYTWSDDGGRHFHPEQRLTDHSCECCRLALAGTPDGGTQIMLRMLYPGNVRDHALARLSLRKPPQAPQRATFSDWSVPACPEQGPGLAVAADGTRHAVWYEASHGPAIWYGQVQPGQPPRQRMKVAGAGAGHADVAVAGSTVWLAWNQVDASGYRLMARVSHDAGKHFAPARALAVAGGWVYSPQLLVRDGRAWVGWNTAAGYRLIAMPKTGDRP